MLFLFVFVFMSSVLGFASSIAWQYEREHQHRSHLAINQWNRGSVLFTLFPILLSTSFYFILFSSLITVFRI